MADVTRYCPERPLPPYTYVPGMNPHPMSDPRGHSFGHVEPAVLPLAEDSYRSNETYLYAIDLFNHGFYWEAHEAWEALWHAAGRAGPTADFLKGLIKLAAAGVKLKEGRGEGVRRHARRGVELLKQSHAARQASAIFGLDINRLITLAKELAMREPQLPADDGDVQLRSENLQMRLELV